MNKTNTSVRMSDKGKELLADPVKAEELAEKIMDQSNRFNIDFIEFSFLVEACIPPRPIARAFFWEQVIDKYYKVLSMQERKQLFEWVNRNEIFQDGIKDGNEDCMLFHARYDPSNQYDVIVLHKQIESDFAAFKWKGRYHISKSTSIEDKFIISVTPLNINQ